MPKYIIKIINNKFNEGYNINKLFEYIIEIVSNFIRSELLNFNKNIN